jgi:hypothetical protein
MPIRRVNFGTTTAHGGAIFHAHLRNGPPVYAHTGLVGKLGTSIAYIVDQLSREQQPGPSVPLLPTYAVRDLSPPYGDFFGTRFDTTEAPCRTNLPVHPCRRNGAVRRCASAMAAVEERCGSFDIGKQSLRYRLLANIGVAGLMAGTGRFFSTRQKSRTRLCFRRLSLPDRVSPCRMPKTPRSGLPRWRISAP